MTVVLKVRLFLKIVMLQSLMLFLKTEIKN